MCDLMEWEGNMVEVLEVMGRMGGWMPMPPPYSSRSLNSYPPKRKKGQRKEIHSDVNSTAMSL